MSALVLSPGLASARSFAGVVTHVTDGDTLWVQPADRSEPPFKLRLRGIDAPEACQSWGTQSTAALAGRVLRARVQVSTRAHDIYGRSLGNVTLSGEDISAWMVASGNAWSLHSRRGWGPYANEERAARETGRGLFADPHAIEPREFRRMHGACAHAGTGRSFR